MKGLLHRIEDDLEGLDPRWPAFLRASHYEALYRLEQMLEKHAEFDRRFPEER